MAARRLERAILGAPHVLPRIERMHMKMQRGHPVGEGFIEYFLPGLRIGHPNLEFRKEYYSMEEAPVSRDSEDAAGAATGTSAVTPASSENPETVVRADPTVPSTTPVSSAEVSAQDTGVVEGTVGAGAGSAERPNLLLVASDVEKRVVNLDDYATPHQLMLRLKQMAI